MTNYVIIQQSSSLHYNVMRITFPAFCYVYVPSRQSTAPVMTATDKKYNSRSIHTYKIGYFINNIILLTTKS